MWASTPTGKNVTSPEPRTPNPEPRKKMFCDECKKNEAVYHSIKILGGVKTERHLCPVCQAKASGAKKPAQSSGLSGLSGLFSNFAAAREIGRRDKACPVCGTTGRAFLETGYLGCDRCYSELSEIVLALVKKVQAGTRHKGKQPRLYGQKLRTGSDASSDECVAPHSAAEYGRLRRELELAVAAENYEQAMVLRDKLRAMNLQ